MIWFFNKKRISANIHNELNEKDAEKIQKKIESNPAFKKEFEAIKAIDDLGKHLKETNPPDSAWDNIVKIIESDSDILSMKNIDVSSPFKRKVYHRWEFRTGIAITAMLLLILNYFNFFSSGKNINIDSYLSNVETNFNLLSAISEIPESYIESTPSEVLSKVGLFNQTDNPDGGYLLVNQRIKKAEQGTEDHIQLIYSNNTDVFAIFIGQHNFVYDFGKRPQITANSGQLQLSIISSQGANTFYYNEGERQYTIVSTFSNIDTAETIMNFFSTAFLSTDPDYYSRPNWAPSGDIIVFEALIDGQFEVYEHIPNLDRFINISNSPASDKDPVFSSNGVIAFSSDRDGSYNLYTSDFRTQQIVQLTNDTDRNMEPTWNPEATHIAYTKQISGNGDIYILDLTSNISEQITTDLAEDSYPVWSPDATKIVFQSNRNGQYDIYVYEVPFKEFYPVTNDLGNDRMPSWSPDGSKIIFSSDRDGNNELYTVDKSGNNLTRITNTELDELYPKYSTEGSRILYKTNLNGGKIFVINSDGSNPVNFVNRR